MVYKMLLVKNSGQYSAETYSATKLLRGIQKTKEDKQGDTEAHIFHPRDHNRRCERDTPTES